VKDFLISSMLVILSSICANSVHANGVRIKDLARLEETKTFSLVGYGIVMGLSGTGDSAKNRMTLQSIRNTLSRFGIELDERDIASRNVASVMITAEMPPYSENGDKIDLVVSSIGDARSLAGGSLMLAPVYGSDEELYAMGQGMLTVGGYDVEKFNNSFRKNFTTVGRVVDGGSVVRSAIQSKFYGDEINLILKNPDYITAVRMVEAIEQKFGGAVVEAMHPGKVKIKFSTLENLMSKIATLESIYVTPDVESRVVVNERTGTIVAGANIVLGAVSIAHGDLKIEITTDYDVSQPIALFRSVNSGETVVTPDTTITVIEENGKTLVTETETSVADLVEALSKLNLSTRDIITILQSIKAAGALHAELVIQ
jgi:flagellar P-ring protein precursor FlgI